MLTDAAQADVGELIFRDTGSHGDERAQRRGERTVIELSRISP